MFLVATYLLGALLHSRAAGAIAAIAATFNAHVLWDSSHLLALTNWYVDFVLDLLG